MHFFRYLITKVVNFRADEIEVSVPNFSLIKGESVLDFPASSATNNEQYFIHHICYWIRNNKDFRNRASDWDNWEPDFGSFDESTLYNLSCNTTPNEP